MVAISGRGLLRIHNQPWKAEKRGLQIPTMALALARTMALDMAWEVFTAGTDSMAMGSGGAPQMRMKQMRWKEKWSDLQSLFMDTMVTMTTTTITIILIMGMAMAGEGLKINAERPFLLNTKINLSITENNCSKDNVYERLWQKGK